jgi:GTPase SAR1 family protein
MGQVFSPPSGFLQKMLREAPKKANCPKCQQETFKRICPKCHYELMYDAGTTDEKIIAIIGGRSSGKSIYIATLINRLENEVGRNFEAAVSCKGDRTRERYKQNFYEPLYKKQQLLQATRTAATEAETKTPMVFRVTFNQNNKLKAVNLVLFDTAGEDMESLDVLSTEARYIGYADAIIFLLDPLQIQAIRQQLPASALPPVISNAEPSYIVQRLRELHEKLLNLKSTDLITKPIAFTLAKTDVLLPIIDPSSVLNHTGDHLGYLNLADVQSVHTEISTYLQNWLDLSFSNNVNVGFKNYRFFGVSALGKAPLSGKVETIASHRVEDPLLWIFHQFGMIKGRK